MENETQEIYEYRDARRPSVCYSCRDILGDGEAAPYWSTRTVSPYGAPGNWDGPRTNRAWHIECCPPEILHEIGKK